MSRFERLVDKLSELSNKYKKFQVKISAESTGSNYEFNRYGNTWDNFQEKIRLLKEKNVKFIFHSTISNLTLFEYNENVYTDWIIQDVIYYFNNGLTNPTVITPPNPPGVTPKLATQLVNTGNSNVVSNNTSVVNTINGINYVDNRFMSIPSGSVTTIFSMDANPGAGTFVTSSVQYIRVTNNSATAPIKLIVSSSTEAMSYLIATGSSYMMSTSKMTGSESGLNFSDIKSLEVTTHWKEVADYMNKYNLVAVPIVSKENELLGMVSVDDILDRLLTWDQRLRKKFSHLFGWS